MKLAPPLHKDPVLILIFLSILLYFHELIFLHHGFLSGDHRIQHYPWACAYADAIKTLRFPWWTSGIHAGFPLVAESQIGAFYPVNMAFFFLFNPLAAWNYEVLFHYLLGGIFIYGFLRQAGPGRTASLAGTLIFLFGTAQGGFYYNVMTHRVLCWFPLTLWLLDEILERKRNLFWLWLALVWGWQWNAGYLQYAAYAIGFSLLYGLRGIVSGFPSRKGAVLWGGAQLLYMGAAFLFSLAVAAPQLMATRELLAFSNRAVSGEAFALLGSMNPLALATLVFPHWDGFLRAEIYAGAPGLFFVLALVLSRPRGKPLFFLGMALFSVFLALGKFNPLYVAAIRLSGWTSFRVPTKFLFFAGTFLALSAAWGLDAWLALSQKQRSTFKKWGLWFGGLVLAGWAGSVGIMNLFQRPLKEFFRSWIENHFVDGVVHTKPLESYFVRLDGFYDSILTMISFSDLWNLVFFFFLAVSLLLVAFLHKVSARLQSCLIIFVLFTNLYVYGMTSIKGNYETPEFVYDQAAAGEAVFRAAGKSFRTHRLATSLRSSEALPMEPNNNMLYGVRAAGAYSPLVMKDYYELMRAIGDMNDSQNVLTAGEDPENIPWEFIDYLNIGFLFSDKPLVRDHLEAIEGSGEDLPYFAYRNTTALPRAFFVSRARTATRADFRSELSGNQFEPTRRVILHGAMPNSMNDEAEYFFPVRTSESPDGTLRFHLKAPAAGYLVTSELSYPGWQISGEAQGTELLDVNGGFRGIRIPGEGDYKIEMRYRPSAAEWVLPGFILQGFLFLLPLAFMILRRRQK